MQQSSDEHILWEAEFAEEVRTFWLLNGMLILVLTLIFIPLIPIWWLIAHLITERYRAHMRCTLTNKSVKVAKGVLVRVEKTVPLDKITDIGLVQGPILRMLKLHTLSIETAGQSAAGSLIRLNGIKEVESFREAVLKQRDTVNTLLPEKPTPTGLMASDSTDALLAEIRDTLQRIEQRIGS